VKDGSRHHEEDHAAGDRVMRELQQQRGGVEGREAWKMAMSASRRLYRTTTTDCAAYRANQAWLGPVLLAKINRFAITPNHAYNSAIPHPPEGRIAIVTDVGRGRRWTRQRRARE
jgi:hypothetical protein